MFPGLLLITLMAKSLIEWRIFQQLTKIRQPFIFYCLLVVVESFFPYLMLLEPVMMYWMCRRQYRLPRFDRLFYSFFSLCFTDLSSRFILFLVIPSVFETSHPHELFLLISYVVSYPLYLLIHEFMSLDLEAIWIMDKGHTSIFLTLRCLLGSMMVYYFLIYALHSPYFGVFVMHHESQLKMVVLFYFLIFLALLSYLNRMSKTHVEKEATASNDQMLTDMESYNRHIEHLYCQLDHFKRSAEKELRQLKERIDEGNLSEIRQVYGDMVSPSVTGSRLTSDDLPCLSRLDVSPVKSLVFSKVIEARRKGIVVKVEVTDDIKEFHMELLDLVLCLSILLDNAIEAAVESTYPSLHIAIMADRTTQIIVVENTMAVQKQSITTIFQRDFSSKGQGRGLGLAKLSDTLAKYSNISLRTKCEEYRFTQIIYLEKNEAEK
ncbi:GHKL domain-containing protein [Streptococcus saliviloxodontae]|uniref:Two-component system sensor histidine kinase AgrC n=2 Tax=Streptococcus saliviloxodontae TaxID=1349416 RepID=A0ABS2PJQ9_9STRE|nr:GHKL domain-containing protein [Streptococcus saliviloxodontae]MBM7635211.1 two-component system sensor histidine kinase AgrC [Streptococcus saliviloxodontae]